MSITTAHPTRYPFYVPITSQYGIVFQSAKAGRFPDNSTVQVMFLDSQTFCVAAQLRLNVSYVTSLVVFESTCFFFADKIGIEIGLSNFVLSVSDIFNSSPQAEFQSCDFDKYNNLMLEFRAQREAKSQEQKFIETARAQHLSCTLSPIQNRGLRLVLQQDKEEDYVITSEGEGRFPVHSYLLNGLWPFFNTATSIDMVEKQSKILHLPYPKQWVQVLVDFFYGKQIHTVDRDVATGLLVVSSTYDIPELKQLAIKNIMTDTDEEEMDLEKAMRGWRRAFESDCAEVQELFVRFLARDLSKIEDSTEAADYSETQLLALFCQAVKIRS